MDFPSLESVLGLEWLGTWVPEHIYNTNQVVDFEANIYVCTIKNINILPTNTEAWNLYKDHPISRMLSADVISQLPVNVPSDNPILVTQPVAFVPPPPLSEWTWINQGPYDDPEDYPLLVTAEDIPGGIRFQVPGPTNFPALIVANDSLPEPPYTITSFLRTGIQGELAIVGLSLRNSDSGDTLTCWLEADGYSMSPVAELDNITTDLFSFTDFFFNGLAFVSHDIVCLRIQNDGSTLHLYTSSDGSFFVEVLKIDVSSLGSFDQYGFYLNNNNNADFSGDPPHLESYLSETEAGHMVVDLLSLEVVPELVDTTIFN